jgi:hypothetical protein
MSGTENPLTAPGPLLVPGDVGGTFPAQDGEISPPINDAGTQDPAVAPGPVEVPGDVGGPAINPAT